jgi:chitin synthase
MDRPPLPSSNPSYGDPFADRPRQTQFADQPAPYHTPRPYESTASLPQEFHQDQYEDDEFVEKQPLAAGQFSGGFYPPGCARPVLFD